MRALARREVFLPRYQVVDFARDRFSGGCVVKDMAEAAVVAEFSGEAETVRASAQRLANLLNSGESED